MCSTRMCWGLVIKAGWLALGGRLEKSIEYTKEDAWWKTFCARRCFSSSAHVAGFFFPLSRLASWMSSWQHNSRGTRQPSPAVKKQSFNLNNQSAVTNQTFHLQRRRRRRRLDNQSILSLSLSMRLFLSLFYLLFHSLFTFLFFLLLLLFSSRRHIYIYNSRIGITFPHQPRPGPRHFESWRWNCLSWLEYQSHCVLSHPNASEDQKPSPSFSSFFSIIISLSLYIYIFFPLLEKEPSFDPSSSDSSLLQRRGNHHILDRWIENTKKNGKEVKKKESNALWRACVCHLHT